MSSNTNIGNTPVNQGYVQLIHTGETGGIDGTLRTLYDGDGTASDLQIASNKVKISTELYIGSKTITEYVQDVVGAMLVTNASHTNLSAAYDDAGDGAIDLTASGEVTLTGSQTLSNKTLASPTFTGDIDFTDANTPRFSVTDDEGTNTPATTIMQSAGGLGSIGTTTSTNFEIISHNQARMKFTPNRAEFNTFAADYDFLVFDDASNALIYGDAGNSRVGILDATPSYTLDVNGTGRFTGAVQLDNNLTITGDLQVNGTTTTVNQTNLDVSDNIIGLNRGAGSNANDSGLIIERGSTGDNAAIIWDESADKFTLGTTTSTPSATGNLTISTGTLVANVEGNVSGNLTTDSVTISTIQTGSESFADNDTSLMTSAAIQDKITSYGYSTTTGTVTSVSVGTGLDVANASSTPSITLDLTELADMTEGVVSADELILLDGSTLKRKAISEITLSTFDATGFSSGISFNGSTANGLLTYGNSTTADVESTLTWNGSDYLNIQSADGAEGGIRLKKSSQDATHTTYSISHRDDNQSLIIYSYDGTTYRNWITLDEPNARLRLGSSTSAESEFVYVHNGRFGVGTQSPSVKLDVAGGDIAIDATQKLYFDGGSHTYIQESSADTLKIFVGGSSLLELVEDSTDYVRVLDNTLLGVGSSNDMNLKHDGTNSFISNGTGALYIDALGQDEDFFIRVNDGGSTITAMKIDSSETARVKLPNDNQRLTFGASDDLHLEHSGTDSYISNQTGDLYIQNQADDKDIIFRGDDGSGGNTAYLTLDGSATTINVAKNMDFADNVNARFGSSSDMNIVHDSSNTFIDNYTGDLKIRNNANDKDVILLSDDGSGGTTAYLTLDGSASRVVIGDVDLSIPATQKLYFDGGGDTFIDEQSTNLLRFRVGNNNALKLSNTEAIINDAGGSFDFRVEGDTDQNLFFTDGSADRVGIGTSSPADKLHVTGSIRTNGEIYLDAGGDSIAFMGVSDANYRKALYSTNDDHYVTNRHTGGDLILMSNNGSAGGETERLRFVAGSGTQNAYFSNVNVGIGVTNPTNKLQVDGNISTDTFFQVDGESCLLRQYVSSWTNATTHDVLYNAYQSNLGDYVYLKTAGNGTNDHGMIVVADSYIFMGRDNHTTGALDNSATAPITDVYMRLDTSGNALFDGDVVAFSSTIASDARLKENVKDLNYGLKDVLDMRAVSFDWKEKRNAQHDIGVIAQEIEKIIPEVVVEVDTLNSEDTHKTVDYAKLTSVLIKAVQEQQQQINELKEKLNG